MAENNNDGGQAFPVPLAPGLDGSMNAGWPGMSMRQYYKGEAPNGFLAAVGPGPTLGMVKFCSEAADAMISEDEEHARKNT